MAVLIGATLALAVGGFASILGLDRERAFYTVVAMIVSTYYALFAIMGGSNSALVVEALVGSGFVALAAVGFKRTMWLVVAALAGHGILDTVHGSLVSNPGLPAWWPAFCAAYDVVAAGYLASLLLSRRRPR